MEALAHQEREKYNINLEYVTLENLENAPEMNDSKLTTMVRLIAWGGIAYSHIFARFGMSGFFLHNAINLTLKHGKLELSVLVYCCCASLMAMIGNFRLPAAFSRLAVNLSSKYFHHMNNTRSFLSQVSKFIDSKT